MGTWGVGPASFPFCGKRKTHIRQARVRVLGSSSGGAASFPRQVLLLRALGSSVHAPQPREHLRKCASFDFPCKAPYMQSSDKGSSFPRRLHTGKVSKQFAEIGIGLDVTSLWTRLVVNERLNKYQFIFDSFAPPPHHSLEPPTSPPSLVSPSSLAATPTPPSPPPAPFAFSAVPTAEKA